MKSLITVILPKESDEILSQLNIALAPHRLDEESIESFKNHHWDYWYFPDRVEGIDKELARKFPQETPEVLVNSHYVRNLPKDYHTSGIIDLTGKWTDLQDFGWSLIKEPSRANDQALEKWKIALKAIWKENENEICVQVVMHN